MRSQTAWLLAALFGALGSPVAAQPPNPPRKPATTCPPQTIQVQAEEVPTGALLFGVGLNSDNGLTGSIRLSLIGEDTSGDCCCAGCPLCAGFQACWRALVRCFVPEDQPPAADSCTCPYVKQRAAAKAAAVGDVGPGHSVLDNLMRLEKAQHLYRKGEYCRHRGRWDSACAYYEKAQRTCPGSRFDRLAAARLREVHARQAAEAAVGGGEEQEVLPMPHKARKPEPIPPPHVVPDGKGTKEDGVFLYPLPGVDAETVLALDRLLSLWSGRAWLPQQVVPLGEREELLQVEQMWEQQWFEALDKQAKAASKKK
jgi:hypothetical protein